MMLILLLPLFISPSKGADQARDALANTKWECKVGKDCVDRLRFRTGGKALSYSCELDEESSGSYRLTGDTLVINTVEDGEEIKERWRYKYLLRGGQLKPIRTEEFIHGNWDLVKSEFDLGYVFHKTPGKG